MSDLLLRHATPLALFPALAAPRDFTAGYCSCRWGTEKCMFTQTSPSVQRLTHTPADSTHPHVSSSSLGKSTPQIGVSLCGCLDELGLKRFQAISVLKSFLFCLHSCLTISSPTRHLNHSSLSGVHQRFCFKILHYILLAAGS